MDEMQRSTVYGYVRTNYNGTCPNDIIQIIYNFYLIIIDSNILNPTEQTSFLDLLYKRLKNQYKNKTIKSMDTKLLYRASENEFSSSIFHQKCDKKGPTFCIIHSDYDYVFGGYANISWDLNGEYSMDDPNSFLYVIRPTMQIFGLKETEKDGIDAIWNDEEFGPVFGNDLCIDDECNVSAESTTYDFKIEQLCGDAALEDDENIRLFKVKEYEVFSIEITVNHYK